MSTLFKLGRRVNHLIFRSPTARWKVRLLGMALLTCPPYVNYKRKRFLTRDPNLTAHDKSMIAKVNCRLSRWDTMFEGDVATYLRVGLSGLRVVESVIQQCPSSVVRNILDLPCGCGRVGRYLAARFPDARITACDLMTKGVDFCAKELGMTPIYSQEDFDKIDLGQRFDLIWCGSLVTHLNPKDILALLRFFDRHLNSNGVVVFTTHGDHVARRLDEGAEYKLGKEAAKSVVNVYRNQGVAFVPYIGHEKTEQYGFALTSPAWIRQQSALFQNWREVFYQPQGWDNHHDVFGYVKTPN